MRMMDEIIEHRIIQRFAQFFERAPYQRNRLQESDAELIDPDPASDEMIAITSDSIVEEIAAGLYDDPFLMGWMLVMVNFSDLAAVGAKPLGLLVSVEVPAQADDAVMKRLSEGISAACRSLGTYVLGGDTNSGDRFALSGTAVGTVPKDSYLTRIGCQLGDSLYLSGRAGAGNAYALLRLSGKQTSQSTEFYRPAARLAEGRLLRGVASCCMDTSDGVIHTVDTLTRLNRRQIRINDNFADMLHPVAHELLQAEDLPPWLALAGVHGEFELCFSVGSGDRERFLALAERHNWQPVLIGEVLDGAGVTLARGLDVVELDTAFIRNLSSTMSSDPREYIAGLIGYAKRVSGK